jgi:hypothetical protein
LILAETLPVPDALETMRCEAATFVLVIDDREGLAGLVTVEDIFEQIVGPIPDEYGDKGRREIRVIGPRELIVGAAVPLHEIEHLLGARLPRKHPISSIGGLVYDLLDRVPRAGDGVEVPGARIEVLSVDRTRLRELRVVARPGTTPPEGPADGSAEGASTASSTDGSGHTDVSPAADPTGRRGVAPDSTRPGESNREPAGAGRRRLELLIGIQLNREALARLRCQKQLVVVPGAPHLFEEPGTLQSVAERAREWFERHLIAQAQ